MTRHSILLLVAGMVCSTLAGTAVAQPPLPPPQPYDTALFTAIRSGSLTSLQQQLTAGSDVNAIQNGFSALMIASLSGTTDQMKLLLDHGAKPNYANPDSITALWMAMPNPEKTMVLLDHGADPNMISKEHYTPLVKLVSFPGTTALFQTMVAKGADPKRAARDNTLLYMAACTDDTLLVKTLLDIGFHPNDPIFNSDYPINSALAFRCAHTVKMLLDHGADANAKLPDTYFPLLRGMTALMQAAVADDEPSFFCLLEHGADINAKSQSGYTALMYASSSETDHPAMTKALLARGADVKVKASGGEDAISLAAKKGNTESLQLLRQTQK
jgi:ankyrin repeat protein